MGIVKKFLKIPSADKRVEQWHVSRRVDICSYAISWLWILIPMLLAAGNDRRVDYPVLYVIAMTLTWTHRHYNFPYAYADSQVFRRNAARFTVFPMLCIGIWLASPHLARMSFSLHHVTFAHIFALIACATVLIHFLRLLANGTRFSPVELAILWGPSLVLSVMPADSAPQLNRAWGWLLASAAAAGILHVRTGSQPERRKTANIITGIVALCAAASLLAPNTFITELPDKNISFNTVLKSLGVVAGVWNLWHVHMQKYGILRLYNAKRDKSKQTPGYIDRWLVFGFFPAYVAWLVPQYSELILKNFPTGRFALKPALIFMNEWATLLIVPGLVCIATGLFLFLWKEWKNERFTNHARLWMGLGTFALASCFFFFDPVKVYLSFAFSHAIEYMVFVWAVQRRRYRTPLAHKPLLGRIMKRPVLAYMAFTVVVSLVFVIGSYWGRYFFVGVPQPEIFGSGITRWVYYWNIYQSMVHFYFDGFMWKMRLPEVRAEI